MFFKLINAPVAMEKLPTTLYRTAQVREFDQRAIHDLNIPGIDLMGRAGSAVFQCLRMQWPQAKSIAVFCGSGNNAGDGYVVAHSALKAGLSVIVYSLVNLEKLTGDALIAYQCYRKAKGVVIPFQCKSLSGTDVIVDALLGSGLDRAVTGVYAQAINVINQASARVIAVDNPSGLNTDTGTVMGCAVKADTTVTFIALKQGLFTGQSADYCGDIVYASLDLPDAVFKDVAPSAMRVVKSVLLPRERCAHKGHYGHVLIIGGDHGYSGAARLAGEAALRVGAGLVSIATRLESAGLMNINRPELMCHGVTSAEQLAVLLDKASVVVLGPGLGQTAWAKALFLQTLAVKKPLIVDADGLNLLAQFPQTNPNWILTPHPGEAARLLSCSTTVIQEDRFSAALALQVKYQGVVVLKGAGTLICSEEECAVSISGNPGMASGGMGDVLAGVIAGLVAQGLFLKNAAQQGVYGHGQAADLAVEQKGERGLLASDLMPYLQQWVN
jgi:ADP-dependent NAD(P)H-hydrate dehydratase / NAD(P)H-hydrate epimerase